MSELTHEEQQIKNAAETFEKYLKNSMPDEYPEWVNDVLITIGDGKTQRLLKHEDWAMGVYELKKDMKAAKSDTVK